MELEPGRDTTGSLVQNLRTGFVPPEPPNRTSWYSANAARVSGRFRAGKKDRSRRAMTAGFGRANFPTLPQKEASDAHVVGQVYPFIRQARCSDQTSERRSK
jgi:hypothetical protein